MAATGAEIANAYVTLSVKMPGVGNQVSQALGGPDVNRALTAGGKSMGAVVAGAVGGAVAAVTSKAVGMVMGAIDGAVKRVDIMNNFPKIMKNLGYSASDATRAINKMSDGLKGLPTSLDAMAGTVQQLAPLTGGLEEATSLSLALNNALLAGGKSTEYQANAMEQYTQMLAIGKVDMAAWRSMVTAMPGQMDQLSVSILGAGNKSMDLYAAMKDGTVTFGQFNAAVMKLNEDGVNGFASFATQAKDATDGIGTGWSNLQTAITRNLAEVIQKLKPAIDAFILGGTQVVNALGPVLVGVIDIAFAVGEWAAANRDWLVPLGISVGILIAYNKALTFIRAAKLAYSAASYGAAAATYAAGAAGKIGAAAYALQNSSLVRLIASLRANEALSLRSKIAIVASTVATNAAAVANRAFNAVLRGNPIGLVVTAIGALVAGLVWFFTKTKLGQKIWGEFTRFLGEAWANVSSFFVTVYEQYLQPVFDGIATVATWVFENILQPLFLVAQFGFAIMAGIFQGVWDFILKPVFDAIGAIFKWVWESIIQPIIGFIILYVQVWGAIFTWLWNTIIKPVFDAIGAIFQWIWNTIISPVVSWISEKIEILGLGFKIMYEQFIKPAWENVASVIKTVWDKVKAVIDTMVRIVKEDPKKAFEAARDAIGTAWAGIQDLAKAPVKFVVDVVLGGLVDAINLIPGVNLAKPKLPKGFATGGILPGMSRMSDGDDQIIAARRGEGIMVSEALRTATDRAAFLAVNAAGRNGVGFATALQGLAKGGFVHPMPGAVVTEEYGGYPGHKGIDLAKPQGTKILAAGPGVVNFSGWYGGGGNMAGVDHGNGYVTRYKHMMRSPSVAVGQRVAAGQLLGFEGSTGDSTGPHLHWEVIKNGVRINPRPYLDGAGDPGMFDIFGGLRDMLLGKLEAAFPGSSVWVKAAGGLAGQGIESAIKWATSLLPVGGGIDPLLYDNGGWLQPGRHLVENRTRRPEPILTDGQWDAIREGRGRGDVNVTNNYEVARDMDPAIFGQKSGRALMGTLAGAGVA